MKNNHPSKPDTPSPRPELKLREILITVVRDPQTGQPSLKLDPPTVDLTINEQVGWRCNDGRLEIRFSPNSTPFSGATSKTARGGTIFSGGSTPGNVNRIPYQYTLLVTNPGGFFIKQDADLRIVDQNTEPRQVIREGLLCRFIHWLERVFC